MAAKRSISSHHGDTVSARGIRWRMARPHKAVSSRLSALRLASGPAAELVAQRCETLEEARQMVQGSTFEQFLRQDWPTLRGLKDLDASARQLADAIASGKKIGISGDYDCDGNSSVALLLRFLAASGVAMDRVHVHIPNRELEGYGVNAQAVDAMLAEKIDLLLTLDNGTSAYGPIQQAAKGGLDVIVADHHGNHAADGLPNAKVINPNRHDEQIPVAGAKDLAAVSVTFLLCLRTLEILKERGHYGRLADAGLRTPPNPKDWLGLVALATVGDVVSLKSPLNRMFVREGLKVINERRDPLLAALAETAQHSLPIDEEAIAFSLAPIVNAPGRLGQSVAWSFLSGASFGDACQRQQQKKLLTGLADMDEARQRLNMHYRPQLLRGQMHKTEGEFSAAEQRVLDKQRQQMQDIERRYGASESLRDARLLMLLSKECNTQRKALEAELLREARAQMREQLALYPDSGSVVVAGVGWHPGLIGIVAGRLKEESGLPVVVGAIDESGREFKCSARGIEDASGKTDIGDAFRRLRQERLFDKAGGHPMAAGGSFSVASSAQMQERITSLRGALEETIGSAARAAKRQASLPVSGILDLASWQQQHGKNSTSALVQQVRGLDAQMRPYGQQNPRPLVAVAHGYVSQLHRSRDGKHLFFEIRQRGCDMALRAVAFHVGGTPLEAALMQGRTQPIHLLGTLSINQFSSASGNNEVLQFRLEDACLSNSKNAARDRIECMDGAHHAAALDGIMKSSSGRSKTR